MEQPVHRLPEPGWLPVVLRDSLVPEDIFLLFCEARGLAHILFCPLDSPVEPVFFLQHFGGSSLQNKAGHSAQEQQGPQTFSDNAPAVGDPAKIPEHKVPRQKAGNRCQKENVGQDPDFFDAPFCLQTFHFSVFVPGGDFQPAVILNIFSDVPSFRFSAHGGSSRHSCTTPFTME